MGKKANEKLKEKGTKDNGTLNLDNEIIIGLKTIPEPKNHKKKAVSSSNQKRTPQNKKKSKNEKNKENIKKTSKKDKNRTSSQNKLKNKRTSKKDEKGKLADDEIELNLGIEEKPKKNKRNKKLTKKQELARKKRRAVLRVLKWITLLGLLLAGVIYFLLSPFFNIKNIIVEGNQKISQEEIISLSGIQIEENTFKLKKENIKQVVKQNAYIDTVSVKRKLPDGIQITVTERTPSFMLTFANAYVYMSSQGYLLEVTDKALELPIITGYQTTEDNIKVGSRLCKEDLQKLGEVLQIMESAKSNQIENLITKINIENKNDYILELKTEKKTVHLGDTSNLSTKMLYILKMIEEEKETEGEILVNTDLNNKGAIFREKV